MIELTLGPLLFNWPADKVDRFYGQIADETEISRVYLGEVVCSKRAPGLEAVLARAAERLDSAGKDVVWSTLALPATNREQAMTEALSALDDVIEINDISALSDRGNRPFVAGPLLNIYNEAALLEFVSLGCVRVVPNVELSLAAIAALHAASPDTPIELFGFGRLPLALSGRCYHARSGGLHKDACQFVCERDPDGRTITTVEGAPFLAMNGIQTLSYGIQVAAASVDQLAGAGIRALRLSPHAVDMVAVSKAFGSFLHKDIESGDLVSALEGMELPAPLVGGYLAGTRGHRSIREVLPELAIPAGQE
jgi:collagenase-like PrtC family protease